MRRLAIVFAVLLLILQPGLLTKGSGTPARPPRPTPTRITPTPLPAVSIASVFAPHAAATKLDISKLITLIATGNVIPARGVNYEMTLKKSFTYPFLNTYKYTSAADLTLMDLEASLFTGCPLSTSGTAFCGDPKVVQGLKLAGVDIADLANNHIGNYGVDAIHETEKHLADAHIAWTGLGQIVYRHVKGVAFAFLGFNGIDQPVDTAEMAKEIRAARKADVVVVSFHWGRDDAAVPMIDPGIASQDPRTIAHLAIQDGADLVIGNNPSVVQGVEMYHGKFIVYANGNFVSDQTEPAEARQGVVGTYVFYGKQLISVRFRAVQIDNGQPRFVSAKTEAAILARMKQSSLTIKAGYKG
jgi:poly-gamma-glutamate capsule biosynthesis protein CapA/YwtB (metallophosphatase superfamily)